MPVIDMKGTGRNIKEMMTLTGKSAKDIQDACGLTTRNAVYRWISGDAMPSIDNLVVIAFLFGTTMDQIIAVRMN
ncbi:MAG: helix-turn-helix transcriptional regulator [Blautia sp.]|nr:helix-turn-helix transcriptional regulator [Blautia sp.]